MCLLTISCFLLLLANISSTILNSNEFDQCQTIGEKCGDNSNCCSQLSCYSSQNENICLPTENYFKRHVDDSYIPPYYNSMNYLYPYGIGMLPFPFYNVYGVKQPKTPQRNKMEWDHCQSHEDCGEGNCCYAHFRFRSLPKSFCRPNRNSQNDLCRPLTNYRSLKDVPAWKQQRQQEKANGLDSTYSH